MFYGLIPLLVLVAIGHGDALFAMPEFLLPFSDALRSTISSGGGGFANSLISGMSMAIVPVLLFGHTVFALGRVYFEQKKRIKSRYAVLDIRDVEHVFPQTKDERRWTAALSVSAGVNEELSFRLLIPVLVFLVSGSAIFAMAMATIWFGLAHHYQGSFGVIATLVLGAIFMFVYLLTQSI